MKELEKWGKPARLLGRSFDLKSAYRPLALSDDSLKWARLAVFCAEDRPVVSSSIVFLPLAKAGGLLEVRTNDPVDWPRGGDSNFILLR